jgi:hypothetical protein
MILNSSQAEFYHSVRKSACEGFSPARDEMCITGGEAQRNLRTPPTKKHKPCKGEIMIVLIDNLIPAGFWGGGGRRSGGFAHLVPSEVKIQY